ncbi:MAG: GntR family transcriptional regulator [Clostridiales bacterium]
MKNDFKIVKKTLSNQVEQALRNMLLDGRWSDGQRLPAEAELAELFNVNRLTVRLAVQRLNAQGLVDIRMGEGIFAKKFSLSQYLSAASDLYITPEMMDDVCEFRKNLEIECARLAIERATQEDIRDMQKCQDRYIEVCQKYSLNTETGLHKRVEADLDLHYCLCRAAHNSLYTLAFNSARAAISNYMKMIQPKRLKGKGLPYYDLGEYTKDGKKELHQLLIDTIVNKDFETCRRLYIAMIDYKLDDPETGIQL